MNSSEAGPSDPARRLQPPSPPTSMSGPVLRRRVRTLDRRAVAFALALCLPYVQAGPVPPAPPSTSPPLASFIAESSRMASSRSFLSSVAVYLRQLELPRRTRHLFLRHIRRTLFSSSLAIPSASVSSARPTLGIAFIDPITRSYSVPAPYVILQQHFNPGFIVLSYCIAFVGSLCTLELLVRRTTNAGWRNQLLIIAAGLTFGAVSTFAMHFIFNNSLSLTHPHLTMGHTKLYLSYDAGYTILSLVASCLAMTIAFFIMGTRPGDWDWLFPRSRRRRGGRRAKRAKMDEEEYGKWKDGQKKALKLGSMGLGELVVRAGSVAKWSLMEGMNTNTGTTTRHGPSEGDEGKWKAAVRKMGGKDVEDGAAVRKLAKLQEQEPWEETGEDAVIRQDKKLQELEFRLGRRAVKLELENRSASGPGTGAGHVDAEAVAGDERAMHRQPSSASMASRPYLQIDVAHANAAKVEGSISSAGTDDSRLSGPGVGVGGQGQLVSDAFAGYSFPVITTSATVPHGLPHSPAYNQRSTGIDIERSTPDAPTETYLERQERRHSSLPAVYALPQRASYDDRALSRIQSETDIEARPTNMRTETEESEAPFDLKKEDAYSPTLRHSTGSGGSQPASEMGRKRGIHLLSGADGRWDAIDRFLGFDVVTWGDILKIMMTGTLAGWGVAAMHYIGQLSITGIPYIGYKPRFVVGSIIIASSAVCVALYIMFIMLRPKLKHGWVAKIGVAMILAVAVCMMHFCGMRGTIYGWRADMPITKHEMLTGSNRAITAIVAALGFGACVACFIFFGLSSFRQRRERARRYRVVVASVLLDEYNRVMVNSTDGTLPMCDIASLSGQEKAVSSKMSMSNASSASEGTVLGMDLSTGHEAFISAAKMTWAWRHTGIIPLPTPLRLDANGDVLSTHSSAVSGSNTLVGSGTSATFDKSRRGSLVSQESTRTGRLMRISVAKFLDRFANATSRLSQIVVGQTDAASRLGVLYDQILTTGWVKLHNSADTVSKGQLIFLVRRITSSSEKQALLNRNFIFADGHAVASAMTKALSVPMEHALPLLEDMTLFCDSTQTGKGSPRSGTLYAGVAVVQATPFDGLRILLEKDNRSQLPMREICSFGTAAGGIDDADALGGTIEELGDAVTWLEGMNLLSVIQRNMASPTDNEVFGGPKVTRLLAALERAIIPMLDDLLSAEDMAHILPRLTLHPVLIPLTPGGPRRGQSPSQLPPYLVVFYANYDAAVNTFTDQWLPFSLFNVQQACVMAPRIASAHKAEAALNAMTVQDGPGTAISARRPSRVQFDFPPQSNAPLGSPSAVGAGAASPFPSPGVTPGAPLFSGFSFPWTENDKDKAADDDTSPSSNASMVSPLHAPPNRHVVPHRSSLARGRFTSVSTESGQLGQPGPGRLSVMADAPVSAAAGAQQKVPGVHAWDPDWLPGLLRGLQQ